MTEQQIQRVLGEHVFRLAHRANCLPMPGCSCGWTRPGTLPKDATPMSAHRAHVAYKVAEALAAQVREGCLFPDCGATSVGDCGRCSPAQVPDISARVRELADEWERAGERLQGVPAAQTWLIVATRLRALLDDSAGGGEPADYEVMVCPRCQKYRPYGCSCALPPRDELALADKGQTGEDAPDASTRRLADAWSRGYQARDGQKPYNSNPWRA
jgi:hypothetical protein